MSRGSLHFVCASSALCSVLTLGYLPMPDSMSSTPFHGVLSGSIVLLLFVVTVDVKSFQPWCGVVYLPPHPLSLRGVTLCFRAPFETSVCVRVGSANLVLLGLCRFSPVVSPPFDWFCCCLSAPPLFCTCGIVIVVASPPDQSRLLEVVGRPSRYGVPEGRYSPCGPAGFV